MIPRLLLLTDRRAAARPLPELVAVAAEAASAAVADSAVAPLWVVLRERDLPRDQRAALAAALRSVLAPAGGRLIVAGPDPLGGDAVHLPAARPYPPPDLPLVGRSCHGLDELARLSTEDYATVSPVYPTLSKPGYGPALGVAGLARLAAVAPAPVLALGGVSTAEHAAACVAAGAAGVAVMGALMRSADPARVVRDLVAGLSVAPSGGRATEGIVRVPGRGADR